jgi:hypothetical protein
MLGLWCMSQLAAAADWSAPQPYALPVLNLSLIAVNGTTTAQASAGLVGGMRIKDRDPPGWLSHTRGALVGQYGVTTGSLGADMRAGSFFGPDGRWIQYQLGPDFWFNGYGNPDAEDYHLPWAPGVELHNALTFKIVRELQLVGEANPGWVFLEERQADNLGPFHELTLTGLVVIRANVLNLTVGYTRQYRSFGVYEGLILSGAL